LRKLQFDILISMERCLTQLAPRVASCDFTSGASKRSYLVKLTVE